MHRPASSLRQTNRVTRRGRHQLRLTLNPLEDRVLLSVAPQMYTVTNVNDSGPGSLRAAIDSANADSYSGSALDTIVFDPSLAGQTIDLTTVGDNSQGSSALAITAPIQIDGSTAPGLTIARLKTSQTPDFRIFYVASGGNLTLNDLTILGGQSINDGGGLLNDGTVTLTGDTLTGNSADNAGGFQKRRHGDADGRHLHPQLRDRHRRRRRRRPRQLRYGDADGQHLHRQLRDRRHRWRARKQLRTYVDQRQIQRQHRKGRQRIL